MSRQPVFEVTMCVICERPRTAVPALVQMNGRCVCSECVNDAAEALVAHYHGPRASEPRPEAARPA